jgi:hypothetical protein
MDTLQITNFEIDGVTNPLIRNHSDLPTVTVAPKIASRHLLAVKGSGPSDSVVWCTLVRLGSTDENQKETLSSTTRFAKSNKGDWHVNFELKHQATYLVACHSGTDNDFAKVVVTHPAQKRRPGSLTTMLSMAPGFTSAKISANGTVFYDYNPVTCTLTPINEQNGTNKSTGTGTGATTQPSQTAPAVFTDSTDWVVSFAPLGNSTTTFSGWYLLEATAANEGTVSATGDV